MRTFWDRILMSRFIKILLSSGRIKTVPSHMISSVAHSKKMLAILSFLIAYFLIKCICSASDCEERATKVASYSLPRRHVPIENTYGVISHSKLQKADFLVSIAYLSESECMITVRRMDSVGWDSSLSVFIDELGNNIFREYFTITPTLSHSNKQIFNTTVRLVPIADNKLDKQQLIPKTIIQTFFTSNASSYLHYNAMQTFLDFNPEYEHRFFDDEDIRIFLTQHYSMSVVNAFDILIAPAFKADIFRYAYILKYGGCYFDHKMILRKPLREIIKADDKLILCLDALIVSGHAPLSSIFATKFYNAIICAQPGDYRLAVVLDTVVSNVHQHKVEGMLAITGPRAMYTTLMNGKNGKLVEENEIRLKHGIHHKNYGERDYRDYYIKDRTTNQVVLTKHYPSYTKPPDQSYSMLWKQGHIFYTLLGQFSFWKVQVYSRHAKFVQAIYTATSNCNNGTILIVSYYHEDIPVHFLHVGTSKQTKRTLPLMGNVVFSF